MHFDCKTDVLIVGGGPTGLGAAIELDRHGLSSLLVERHAVTREHPRASVVNTRSVEICRSWGVADAVAAEAMQLVPGLGVTWTTRLAARELGRLLLIEDFTRGMFDLAMSAVLPMICPQDRFEPILRARAEAAQRATLRFSTRFVELDDQGDFVVATLEDAEGRRTRVRANWVIAADGARSGVRDALGIGMHGSDAVSEQVNIYVHADLTRLVEDRPSVLFYMVNPDVRGFFIALDGRERWLVNAARSEVGELTEARCAEVVRAAIGTDDIAFEIRGIDAWTVTAQVADAYRRGRVLLAGDAAHRFPHTGGFGLNTGLQDVHNLVWKLAAVHAGRADERLLDTYEAERRPVAQSNCDFSVRNAENLSETGVPFARPSMDVAEIERDTAAGEAVRQRIAAAIPGQRDHFDFRGQELGFRYASAAVLDDGSEPGPWSIGTYTPSGRPGGRAPHLWITRAGERISTHDLWSPGWALIAGPAAGESAASAQRAAQEAGLGLTTVLAGRDVEADEPGAIEAAYGIAPDGAVLVRPDGHVAWRARESASTAEWDAIFSVLLARTPAAAPAAK